MATTAKDRVDDRSGGTEGTAGRVESLRYVMTSPVVTVTCDTRVRTAGVLRNVDRTGTDRETVRHAMLPATTPDVDASITDVIETMSRLRVRSIPVSDRGKPVGMITWRDVLRESRHLWRPGNPDTCSGVGHAQG